MTASSDRPRALVDTNILVYAYDTDDPSKHTIARELLERLSNEGRLIYSSQVFNEFCSVMMRPNRPNRMTPAQLVITVQRLTATGDVVPMTPELTLRALDAMPRHAMSFWDAMIWAAAAENGASILYTEDFQAGREVEGVHFVNPFQDDQAPTP